MQIKLIIEVINKLNDAHYDAAYRSGDKMSPKQRKAFNAKLANNIKEARALLTDANA